MPTRRDRKETKPTSRKAFAHGDIEPYLKYLAKVPRQVTQRRLKMYRLKEEVIKVNSIICLSEEISNRFAKWRDFIHPLDPVSLDDLKNWFGVPNEAARQQLKQTRALSEGGKMWGRLTQVRVLNLPTQRDFDFRKLDHEQRVAVKQMANNLLYGYVDADEARRPRTAAVISYMLEQAHALHPKIFVSPNLIVCPDDNVIFDNIPVLFFNNILIYGEGQITTRGHTKINAQQIQHLDA